uniref:DUF7809 domain-containing protein n=1 Tax=Caenorhabditis japonica TaxID=281687 RepID=A0A8R1DWI0_CAEJA
MYGSARELVTNLEIYSRFVGRERFFGLDLISSYFSKLHFTTRIKQNQQLFRKDFMFSKLFYLALEYVDGLNIEGMWVFPLYIVSLILKRYEKKVLDRWELVEITTEDIRQLKDAFNDFISICSFFNRSTCSSQNLFNELKQLVPWETEKNLEFLKYVAEVYTAVEKDYNYREVITVSAILIDCIDKTILKFPQFFKSTMPKTLRYYVVRVFTDGKSVFILEEEYRNVWKLWWAGPPQLMRFGTDITENPLFLHTFVIENSLDHQRKKEWLHPIDVHYETISRTKHHACPIMISSEKFCILASDFFFTVFRELLFSLKLFQRLKKDEWSEMQEYFKFLSEFFDGNVRKRYFLKVDSDNCEKLDVRIINEARKRFHFLLERPAKDVRNAKKDGFTVENLKNELKNLGLLDVFPDILDYADQSYKQVLEKKGEHILRTCDLFDAVELCQLSCVLNRYPQFAVFLHNQNASWVVPGLPCVFCGDSVHPMHNNYLQTKSFLWRLEDVQLVHSATPYHSQFSQVMNGNMGTILTYNETIFAKTLDGLKKQNINIPRGDLKVFLMDMADDKKASEVLRNKFMLFKWHYSMSNLFAFSNEHQKINFYLRLFSRTRSSGYYNYRFFADEVLEMFRSLITNPNPVKELEKIEKFLKSWAAKANFGYRTIPYAALKCAFDDFDTVKELFFVPDPSYIASSTQDVIVKSGTSSVTLFAPDYTRVMDVSQAVFQIFQSVVCDVDWSVEVCKKHPNCMDSFKAEILTAMRWYLELEEGIYVPENNALVKVRNLRQHCNYTQRKSTITPLLELYECDILDEISLSYFAKLCRQFQLSDFQFPNGINEHQLEKGRLHVWKARILFMVAWMDIFFDNDTKDLKAMAKQALYYRIPVKQWYDDTDFQKALFNLDSRQEKEIEEVLQWSVGVIPSCTEQHEWLIGRKENQNIIKSIKTIHFEPIRGKYNQDDAVVKKLTKTILEKMMKNQEKTKKISEFSNEILKKIVVSSRIKQTIGTIKETPKANVTEIVPISDSTVENVSVATNTDESGPCKECQRSERMREKAAKELKESQEKVTILEKTLAGADMKLENSEAIQKTLEQKKVELETIIEQENNRRKKIIDDLQDAQEENFSLKSEVSRVEEENNRLKTDISRLKSENQKQEQMIEELSKKLAALTDHESDELADKECVICISDMDSHDDTMQCTNCKRRYHNPLPFVSSEYSELMNQEIGVRVEVLNLVYHNESIATSTGHPRCRLTLHKDTCSSPQFNKNDTLSWSTRVCYKWVCDTTKYAMRVESCWIGTPKMPVFIVRDDGCTIEKAILTSPVYTSFNRAAAIGWMAVRQKSE